MSDDEACRLVIEPLGPKHNRPAFRSGNEALDYYIKKQAKVDVKRRISRVFVATTKEQSSCILGYYTLSSLSINLSELPPKLSKKLPKHPVPAALIGRLAVSIQAQGTGIGKMLLANAVRRTQSISEDIAIYTMVVDAIDEQAEGFYKKFGFIELQNDGRRLFLPLKSF